MVFTVINTNDNDNSPCSYDALNTIAANTVRKIIFKYMIKSTRIQHFIQENISSLSNKSSILHQIMNGM